MSLTGRPVTFKPPKPVRGGTAARAHMAAVSRLPCLVCGTWPVEVHHVGKPKHDLKVAPLCPQHHRREYGPGAYHYSPKAFAELHGTDEEILKRVADMLD